MNKAILLYEEFGKVFESRRGIDEQKKGCVEVFISEMEKLCHEFEDAPKMAYRLQEIREDLEKL